MKRILIFRTDGIGDVLNSTPAISALRDAYQDAHISVVARSPSADVLLLNPHIDEVLTFEPDRIISKLRFLKQLRSEHYDMAIVLRNSSWCNLMAYLSGARYRVGRRSERKGFSFTLTYSVGFCDPKGTKHEIDRNMDVVRLVGAKDASHKLILRLSDEERTFAKNFLRGHGVMDEDRLLGIHPGGSSFDKLWPAENFAEIANLFVSSELRARVIIFGGPGEEELIRRVSQTLIQSPILAVGQGLRKLAALIERCSLFLCNDSGPMHIAAALKVPTIAIFGPTDHIRWRPCNENATVVRRDMDCWPCSAHKCKKEFECIRSLSVKDVWDVIVRKQNL